MRIALAIFMFLTSTVSYGAFISFGTFVPPPPSNCPQGTSLPDGCSGSQAAGHGTIVNANLANAQQVIALNIIAGSGYTNGTFTWTSTGGGCSVNASGTITVTGGAIGVLASTYTISNNGSGCTSRPTIAIPAGASGGSGGSITPTVYQLTPHNAATKWNVAGVDYPVGYDTTLSLSDPTGGGLPSGCSYSNPTVTCSSGTPVLNGWDFTLHNTHLVISGGTVTVSNSKFGCISTQLDEISISGGTAVTIQYNNFNGGASPNTACTSGGQNAAISITSTSGTITIQYNYCYNQDSKCIILSNGGTSGSPIVINEQFNYWYDFGICGSGCSHGEAEYFYPGSNQPGRVVTWSLLYNVILVDFNNSLSSNLTSPASLEADGGTQHSPLADHNLMLAQGTQSYTGSSNSTGQVASASLFCGAQEGGAYSGSPVSSNNLMDYSGAFYPYNNAAACAAAFTISDKNAGTGNSCNATNCN